MLRVLFHIVVWTSTWNQLSHTRPISTSFLSVNLWIACYGSHPTVSERSYTVGWSFFSDISFHFSNCISQIYCSGKTHLGSFNKVCMYVWKWRFYLNSRIACVAWRFKQFERERTKRRSRVSQLFLFQAAHGFAAFWRSLSRLRRFLRALKLRKNRQAKQVYSRSED